MSRRVLLLTGLGADERLFGRLHFAGLPTQHILYTDPRGCKDLAAYAQRLATQLVPGNDDVYVGCSLGGMLAIELAKLHPPTRVILLSSIKGQWEQPFYFKVMRTLRLYKMVSPTAQKRMTAIIRWLFGKMQPDVLQLIMEMWHNTPDHFIRWAEHAALHWTNQARIPNLVHIHGTHDLVFPCKYISDYHPIAGGRHVMVLTNATAVDAAMRPYLLT